MRSPVNSNQMEPHVATLGVSSCDMSTQKATRLAYSVPEAAYLIGVSESMVWKLLEKHELARVKVGRRTLIRVAEIELFLDKNDESQLDLKS